MYSLVLFKAKDHGQPFVGIKGDNKIIPMSIGTTLFKSFESFEKGEYSEVDFNEFYTINIEEVEILSEGF